MKRTMKLWVAVFACFFFTAAMQEASARQEPENGKITIKIQTNKNGKSEVFEKTYNNREEMMNDPEYRELMGNTPGFRFNFFTDSASGLSRFGDMGFDFSRLEDLNFDFSWMDSMKVKDGQGFFSFPEGEENGNMRFFFGDGDNPIIMKEKRIFRDSLLQNLGKDREIEKDLELFFYDNNEMLNEDEFRMRFRDMRNRPFNNNQRIIIMDKDRVKLEDLEAADRSLNKIGNRKADPLVLQDFTYYPDPSTGKLALKFRISDESAVSVKLYDQNGEELYTEGYRNFSGSYRGSINISRLESGSYLLEITKDKKVLRKKLEIKEK